jgi:hypothetical protein
MLRQVAYRVGSRVRVYSVAGGYRLPTGLPEGSQVVVLAIEPGMRVVEFEGQAFLVPMACIN